MAAELPNGVSREKIWDPGLRLFHWTLAVCVSGAWMLGHFGPNVMTLHFYFGYAVIVLLGFRVIWGLIGPGPARFSHFTYGPGATARYIARLGKRAPSYWPGHNPLGALAVFTLLGALMVQVGAGLFSDPDDYINVGPLAGMVDREANRTATWLHNRMAWGILALVGLHLSAILFYRFFKREDLVTPMIAGWKLVRRDRSE
ncbi:cytochrome b/b6 domain-containing protein [Alisedimentitalea sp. MJ-SS2]|uniref:cytochrome b/b6 domain-containing protein n=1 Tax=Aliisedimentitalea sp. MJ-SS2 TaxID=3049795 RepID=UPI00290B0FC0|nr:cytochrome b/b6 domain-containing protein [Alisedimentitalea sp. MJ-SS2]MDU8928605.1 cytochrome b/b6 domain-containing protein [Alisedimentitalea sp. MJ-SS2]